MLLAVIRSRFRIGEGKLGADVRPRARSSSAATKQPVYGPGRLRLPLVPSRALACHDVTAEASQVFPFQVRLIRTWIRAAGIAQPSAARAGFRARRQPLLTS